MKLLSASPELLRHLASGAPHAGSTTKKTMTIENTGTFPISSGASGSACHRRRESHSARQRVWAERWS